MIILLMENNWNFETNMIFNYQFIIKIFTSSVTDFLWPILRDTELNFSNFYTPNNPSHLPNMKTLTGQEVNKEEKN